MEWTVYRAVWSCSLRKSLGFEKVVGAHLEVKRSWRRYSTVELLTCLISMIVLGVERISHRDCLGEDRAFLEMLGLERFPSASALYRFLRAMYVFNTRAPSGVHVQGSVCIAQMARIITHLLHRVNRVIDRLRQVTLDLDSTVLTVHGKQEGARVEYNPHKRGKRSYHPLLCFIAETGDYLYGKLRKGDAASATGLIPLQTLLCTCLHEVPESPAGDGGKDAGACRRGVLTREPSSTFWRRGISSMLLPPGRPGDWDGV